MGSEIKDINDKTDHLKANSWYSINEISNSSNLNHSIAEIVSAYDDMTTFDVLLLNENVYVYGIEARIHPDQLNTIGHLSLGDTVLVSHKGKRRGCEIVSKLNKPGRNISQSVSVKKTTGSFNRGVLAA